MKVNTGEAVWILEMNENPLNIDKSGQKNYRFKGSCAEWGVMNENERLYDRDDYVNKAAPLKDKIKTRSLLGELDHNEDFLVELKNASHIITDLEEVTNGMDISIELLDTDEGKNAKALADAGVPLFISSRASGYIDRMGNVTLEKIYTYDLVSEPGFKNAELQPVNESKIKTGQVKSPRFQILKMREREDTSKSSTTKKINTSNKNSMSEFVTKKDLDRTMNNFMESIKKVIGNGMTGGRQLVKIHESLNTPKELSYNGVAVEILNAVPEVDDTLTADGEDYTINDVVDIDSTEETDEDYKLRGTYKYKLSMLDSAGTEVFGYMSSTGELHLSGTADNDDPIEIVQVKNALKLISDKVNELIDNHNGHRSEHRALVKYVDMFAKLFQHQVNEGNKTIEFVNKLADNSDEMAEFINTLADHSDEATKFINRIAKATDDNARFANDLADHSDASTKVLNSLIRTSDRATAHLNNLTVSKDKLTQQVRENTENIGGKRSNMITESKGKGQIINTVKNILETAKTNKANDQEIVIGAKYPFTKGMGKEDKSEFLKLDDDGRQMVLESVNSGKDAVQSIKDVASKREGLEFIKLMPEEVKPLWASLPVSRKNSIIALYRSKNVRSSVESELFWDNIDLRDNQFGVQSIHESKGGSGADVAVLGYTDEEMDGVLGL